jgi:hypothetical protein
MKQDGPTYDFYRRSVQAHEQGRGRVSGRSSSDDAFDRLAHIRMSVTFSSHKS